MSGPEIGEGTEKEPTRAGAMAPSRPGPEPKASERSRLLKRALFPGRPIPATNSLLIRRGHGTAPRGPTTTAAMTWAAILVLDRSGAPSASARMHAFDPQWAGTDHDHRRPLRQRLAPAVPCVARGAGAPLVVTEPSSKAARAAISGHGPGTALGPRRRLVAFAGRCRHRLSVGEGRLHRPITAPSSWPTDRDFQRLRRCHNPGTRTRGRRLADDRLPARQGFRAPPFWGPLFAARWCARSRGAGMILLWVAFVSP
jgi:hypothetical protein